MDLNTLKPALGSVKQGKRIGRGPGSGHGKTATKGHKGQKARSGGSIKAGFEGGQMPLQRRLPKRGFTPLSRVEYAIVNLKQLDAFEANSSVDTESLVAMGLVKSTACAVKILGNGDLAKSLRVSASKFSQSAKDKILAAGGTVEETV
ncbi:50S ribosomal protein L15 [Pelobacter propionicus]|uniref:Large ribosomal subunit protein uL15 n=1 Tax=Pelobacter propionicus (strain DSM 2379 / NBRC 103807 / OttBd1) TaxID=338966 RepID=RL15_PELPD|nr:50S ribosomal protein L15 [Pelobacter propionicus]A1ALW0.1 RecName: Full=Large ribosomal subunit protein uL15; AltName: Full=50S ribosomal protein L15 [Pelobacter propionicus DSM 2379]ABK98330.1 LSU ribosomal protein L15P [Pelobacter propionicus DSM 2379]